MRTPDPGARAATRSALPRAAVLLAALLAVPGCARPVLVGAIVSDTGAAAPYGEKVRRGLELALDEVRAAGGVGARVRILYRDDATNPEIGAQVARELVEKEGVRLLIGAVSSPVTLSIAPICQSGRAVLLSPTSSSPEITGAGEWVYRNYPSDTLEGTSLADFARDLGLRRVAVLGVQNEYGAGLSKVFAEHFAGDAREVIGTFTFRAGDADAFPVLAARVSGLRPDGIYLAGYADDTAGILRALREAGFASVVLGTSSVTADAARRAGPAAEGLVFPEVAFDPQSPRRATRSFVAAYRARFREDPDSFAAHGYDALKVLVLAIQRGGSPDPDSVRKGLNSIDDYSGASGQVAFDENGDVVQYPRMFIVHHGHAEPYDRFVEGGGSLPVPPAD